MEYLIAIIIVVALTLGAFCLYKIGEYKGYESGYEDATNYAISLLAIKIKEDDYGQEKMEG